MVKKINSNKNKSKKLLFLALISIIFLISMIYSVNAAQPVKGQCDSLKEDCVAGNNKEANLATATDLHNENGPGEEGKCWGINPNTNKPYSSCGPLCQECMTACQAAISACAATTEGGNHDGEGGTPAPAPGHTEEGGTPSKTCDTYETNSYHWVAKGKEGNECENDSEGKAISVGNDKISDVANHPSEICCKKLTTEKPKCDAYGNGGDHQWVENTDEAKNLSCAKKADGKTFDIVDNKELLPSDIEANKPKVCCKTITKENPGPTSPMTTGGDLFGICFGQMGDIWTKGYAVLEVSDPKKVEELGKTIKLKDTGRKNKENPIYEYQVGVTPVECIANYMAIVYGAVTSIVLMTQGGDREIGSCSLEKPLPGSDYCKTCNEDPYRICTKERCEILGKCIALADKENATGEYRCEQGACEEKGDIELSKIESHWYGDTEEIGNKTSTSGSRKGTIKLDINEIAWNTKMISLTITTSELAQCKYILDKPNTNFSEMTDFEDNYYPENKQQSINIPLEGDISRNANHTIYIKCNNICDLPHAASYDYNQVKFKLQKKPDQLPPEIVFVDPATNSVVRSDLEYINASFWLDEKGTCKFSDISINFTSNYNDTRQQTMIPFGQISPYPLNSSVEAGGCYQAKCLDRNEQCSRCWLKINPARGFETMNSTSPEFNETKIYHFLIRCDDGRNIMTQDSILDYIIMTAPGYEINITKPEQGQKDYDDLPNIEVTSGTRNTQCKYKIYNGSVAPVIPPTWEEMTFIDEAISTIHDGEHNESLQGSSQGRPYTMEVLCRDTWNMEARAGVTFFILKDSDAPRLVRTYHDVLTGDFLTIETDEESTCFFSYTGCNFNFSQGNSMTGDLQYLHSAYWRDKTFFVKCTDKWNNYPVAPGSAINSTSNPGYDYCTAILKPFEIPIIV